MQGTSKAQSRALLYLIRVCNTSKLYYTILIAVKMREKIKFIWQTCQNTATI